MKIEWLDENMERARLTRGWFRRRTAVVKREYKPDVQVRWFYELDGEPPVPRALDALLEKRRWKAKKREIRRLITEQDAKHWTPVKP